MSLYYLPPGYYPYYQNYRGIYPTPMAYYASIPTPLIYRQFPEVNPEMFMSSAKEMEVLMKNASRLLAVMASSRKFSLQLMNAAQDSKLKEVENMIHSTGITVQPKVSYTPDGLNLHFDSSKPNDDCCKLTLKLRWK